MWCSYRATKRMAAPAPRPNDTRGDAGVGRANSSTVRRIVPGRIGEFAREVRVAIDITFVADCGQAAVDAAARRIDRGDDPRIAAGTYCAHLAFPEGKVRRANARC